MEEFYQLDSRNNLSKTEGKQVAQYVGVLQVSIQDHVSLHIVWTLSKAVNLAMKIEMARQPARPKPIRQTVKAAESHTPPSQHQAEQVRRSQGESSGTEAPKGSTAPSQGKGPSSNPCARPMLGKCFHYGQPGHRSNECPNRRAVNMVELTDEGEALLEKAGRPEEENLGDC
jgi:hypothetical protein